MDFFKAQGTLETAEWILRAVYSFFFLILSAKCMGRRAISQMGLLDFIMALIIGNILAHPLSDPRLGIKGSSISMSVLVFLYTSISFLSLKWKTLRYIIDPPPFPLIKDGRIVYRNLWRARISLDYLLASLRGEKITDPKKVALALWEQNGSVSCFLKPEHDPVTPKQFKLQVAPFYMPVTVIKEGKVIEEELKLIGKDMNWLLQKVDSAEIKNILLAVHTQDDKLDLFYYK
ncbi:DUF421 domain-containing protein [Actinomycetes bacterium NPDC127524]